MGVVYKARQARLNRIVALKMILAGQLASDDDVKRFYAEAEAAANLNHPNIVPIYEVGEHEGQHYFSMGFVDGESLAERIAEGPLEPNEAAELTREIAEAIAYAHGQGVIHRDLKPANVLLESADSRLPAEDDTDQSKIKNPKSQIPKITDFGLAKRTEDHSGLTHTGQILGTPSYMPPKQAAGLIDAVTPAADIYALGSILYCLLTGRPPFQAANPLDTLMQVLHNEAPSPREINPNIPRDLETICLKCLQKEAPRRYESAQALADDLGRYQRDEPIHARPVGRIERAVKWVKRRPAIAALMAAVALTLVAGTVVSTWFAVQANLHAQAEKTARETAEANEQKAKDLADDKARLANEKSLLAEEKSQLAESERAARQQQERLRAVAIDERNTAMRNLYIANAYQVQHAWSENRFGRLNELLNRWNDDSFNGKPQATTFGPGLPTRPEEPTEGFREDSGRPAVGESGSVERPATTQGSVGRPATTQGRPATTQGRQATTQGRPATTQGRQATTQGRPATTHFPDPRGFEWFYLRSQHDRTITVLPTKSGSTSIAWRHDGQRIAASSYSNEVTIWDIELRRLHRVLRGHSGAAVLHTAWSHDGGLIASASVDKTAIIWDAESGEVRFQLDHNAGVRCVGFASDGRLATIGDEPTLRIWDSQTGEQLQEISAHEETIWRMAWNNDGTRLATCTRREVRIWDTETWELERHIDPKQYVSAITWSPDGTRLATSGSGLKIWDVATGEATVLRERYFGLRSLS